MDMNGDKTPGPDDFTVAIWQSCWDFVKEEILDIFKEFHEQNSFLKSLNNTFLVLLLKRGGAEDLGDYRPISLVGGLYKLLAKVLANRLKKVIGNGQFSVKKAYSLLASLVAAVFPKSNVWVDRVPTKIAFFVWEAAWGKVLTLDRLQKRGW